VPIGFAGEMYIAGHGLARGYLHLPGATAASFVANPFGVPGSRMYRTGDHARWREDGQLEFIGRGDYQVKVRGFRVELGEVESSIARHPCVDRAVVVAHAAPTRGSYLIGYVTPAKDRVLVVTELNSFLRGRIPAYMIPSEFLALDALPLTRNGKINYDLLPAPSRASGNGRPPQSGEEKFLCEAFSELLGVSDVSVSDSFFDLGGNSLLAVSLINRVRAALHAEIGIRDVFDAPTIAQLAERLRDSRPDRPVLHARSQQSGQ
jgi:nonribosomal peptide synthetase DhbF